MQLTLDGRKCIFIPIQTFRQQWDLPDDFGMLSFEPKDWPVGKMDGSSQTLAMVKQQVLRSVPPAVAPAELLAQIRQLAALFRHELTIANEQIGLREVEIDFAVDGFQDILRNVAYHLFELKQIYQGNSALIRENFDFAGVYQAWLDASTRLLTTRYSYTHNEITFELQVVYNAYGRMGFQVSAAGQTHYVLDTTLTCPAANYMKDLCERIAAALVEAFLWA